MCQVLVRFGRWRLKTLVLAALILLQAAVPFTPEPRAPQWRIGFDLGNALIVETPELNPKGDPRLAIEEAERALPDRQLSFGLALLPFSKIATENQQLLNPKQWTVVDLQGKTAKHAFQSIGVFMGRRMTSTEGGYHFVSLPLVPFQPVSRCAAPGFVGGFDLRFRRSVEKEDHGSDAVFGNPMGKSSTRRECRRSSSGIRNSEAIAQRQRRIRPTALPLRNLDSGIDPESNHQTLASQLQPSGHNDGDTSVGNFRRAFRRSRAVYVSKPAKSDNEYVAYLTAAVDLNQDGTDELVVEASYRNGTAYKVISATAGKYSDIYTSYYRGQ